MAKGDDIEELNETRIWLKIIARSELLPAPRMPEIIGECEALCRILNASVTTARRNLQLVPDPDRPSTIDH